MSVAQMSPDSAWIVGSAVTAAIMAGPAYIAAKRGSRKAESTEHAEEFFGRVLGHLEEQRDQLNDIRSWQAEHTTEHAVSKLMAPSLEIRKGK